MTTTNLLAIAADGAIATVRTGRHGRDGISWSDPFAAVLLIQRDRKGRIVGLSLRGQSFAEFDPRHHTEGPNLFMAEDYALEILRVEPAAT